MNYKPDNPVVGMIVAAIVGAVVVGAWALTSVVGVDSSLDDATALHAVDMSVSAQDLAKSAVGQSVLLAASASSGVASAADVAAATRAADAAIAEAAARFQQLPATVRAEHEADLAAWQVAAGEAVAQAANGDAVTAASTMADAVAPAATLLATDLLAERDRLAESIADARSAVGRLARLLGFCVVFLLPLVGIVVYRIAAQRRLSTAFELLDARVEAEATTGDDRGLADFAGELQEPLASIDEYSRLLLDGRSTDAQLDHDLLRLINSRAVAISNRVDDVLVASAGDDALAHVVSRPLSVGKLIDSVVAAFTNQGFVIGGTHGEGAVMGDESKVRQILRNLIDNAVTHGGPNVRVYGDAAGSMYVVSIEDNGSGLPDAVAAEFERTSPAASKGLGLRVARRLAAAMGGSVDYDRMAGRTSFVLSLPLAAEPAMDDAVLIAVEQ